MGYQWINETIQALQQAGIRAQRGFPVEKIPYLTTSVAGVSVDLVQAGMITLAVRIYTPLKQGGAVCEETAALAAETLIPLGADCQISRCLTNMAPMGLFRMTVLATFPQQQMQ